MRKVKYGRFVDFMPPVMDYDDGLIGGHRYVRHAQSESLKTAGYEYYIEKDGRKITIEDATIFEKARALILFAFVYNKKRVLGVRTESSINPYSDSEPQLGVKLDESGKKVVDTSYYQEAQTRAMEKGDRKAANDIKNKLQATKEYLNSLNEENTEKNIDEENINSKKKK